jgi:2-polyprenyl-3-methyl-5-hydroxy-6-metoxy-1,4-benzoquinol methylase
MKPLTRSEQSEILDHPVADHDAFVHAISYLEWSNRWFGNYWMITHHLKHLLPKITHTPIRFLDIGTGIGDLPAMLMRWARRQGHEIDVIGTDDNAAVIAEARRRHHDPHMHFLTIAEDGGQDQSKPSPVEITIISQVLHHLTPDEAVELLRAACARSTRAVVISDLERSRLAYWLVRIGVSLTTRSRIARHDGALSVLRSYTNTEIAALLHRAGIAQYRIYRYLPRKIVIIEKPRS